MEIIAAIREGDATVFEEVFIEFHERIFGFFMKKTALNRDVSKELTQLTFIKLWQSKHTLSSEYALDKQLFVMAKHTLIDFLRREANFNKTKEAISKNELVHTTATYVNDTMFESNNYVLNQLKVLPPVRNKVLQMKVLQGYSNKQIASSLSISIKTVEDHITKGLSELRSHAALTLHVITMVILLQL